MLHFAMKYLPLAATSSQIHKIFLLPGLSLPLLPNYTATHKPPTLYMCYLTNLAATLPTCYLTNLLPSNFTSLGQA